MGEWSVSILYRQYRPGLNNDLDLSSGESFTSWTLARPDERYR